jgi:hypothetical protein
MEIDTKNKKHKSIVDLEDDLEGEHDTYKFFRYVSDIIPNNRFLVDENPAKQAEQHLVKDGKLMANFDDEKDKKLLERISKLDFKVASESKDASSSIHHLFEMSKQQFASFVDQEEDEEEKLFFLDQIERDIQKEKISGFLEPSHGLQNPEAPNNQLFDDSDLLLEPTSNVDPIQILDGISLEETDPEASNQQRISLPPVYLQQEHEGFHNKKL